MFKDVATVFVLGSLGVFKKNAARKHFSGNNLGVFTFDSTECSFVLNFSFYSEDYFPHNFVRKIS